MITPIDSRLWLVKDLLSSDQLNYIQQLPWLEFDWQKQEMQEHWPRRKVLDNRVEIGKINAFIQDRLPEINQALGTNFSSCGGHWWIDMPGFACAMHTDGHLPNSMQLYWIAPNDSLGTVFYTHRDRSEIRHRFVSQPNSGYIMLNQLCEDGSQPLQWHDMPNPVPADTIRVSSYFYFYK